MARIIDRKELQTLLSKNPPPVLLEALPAKYYLEGHLGGALHFPPRPLQGAGTNFDRGQDARNCRLLRIE